MTPKELLKVNETSVLDSNFGTDLWEFLGSWHLDAPCRWCQSSCHCVCHSFDQLRWDLSAFGAVGPAVRCGPRWGRCTSANEKCDQLHLNWTFAANGMWRAWNNFFLSWAELNLCWFAHYAAITTKVMEPDGEQVADEISTRRYILYSAQFEKFEVYHFVQRVTSRDCWWTWTLSEWYARDCWFSVPMVFHVVVYFYENIKTLEQTDVATDNLLVFQQSVNAATSGYNASSVWHDGCKMASGEIRPGVESLAAPQNMQKSRSLLKQW